MRIVIILTLFSNLLFSKSIYDFWDNSNNTNEKNRVEVKEIDRSEYRYQSDSKRPTLSSDFDRKKIKKANDLQQTSIQDRYFKYNIRGEKDPNLANDIDPNKIKLAPDYMNYTKLPPKKRVIVKKNQKIEEEDISSSEQLLKYNKTKENSYKDNYIVFYDENAREESFIDVIPYVTIGNSLFEISSGGYSARVLDDSVSASVTVDLGLNYIWDNRNIGYLWNINLGNYDFNEKDRKNPDTQAGGKISGFILSAMPTIFYELNRAQTMSVFFGYGLGTSFIKLDGSATLANSTNQTTQRDISIEDFYFSHGLLIEILHNNMMVSFTKVNMKIKKSSQNIKINENRLNIGYKFSF